MGRFWLDTDFAGHAKLLALGNPAKRWAWLEVLIYTCKYGSPEVPPLIREVVPRATPAFLEDCERVGLLDRDGDRLLVHDWHLYQGTVEERVTAYLDRNPEASANTVQQAVAGKREQVLAAVRRYHEHSSPTGSREPDPVVPREPGLVVLSDSALETSSKAVDVASYDERPEPQIRAIIDRELGAA